MSTENTPKCCECGIEENKEEGPWLYKRYYRDITDTDRGDWVQEGYEWVCTNCDEGVNPPTVGNEVY